MLQSTSSSGTNDIRSSDTFDPELGCNDEGCLLSNTQRR